MERYGRVSKQRAFLRGILLHVDVRCAALGTHLVADDGIILSVTEHCKEGGDGALGLHLTQHVRNLVTEEAGACLV